MKRSPIPTLFIFLSSLLVCSCISPLDTDTPRNRYVDAGGNNQNGHERITAKSIMIKVRSQDGDSLIWQTSLTDSLAQIDTTNGLFALWFKVDVWRYTGKTKLPCISEFRFSVDSASCDNHTIDLVRDSTVTPAATYTLALESSPNGTRYAAFPATPRVAYAYCSFRHYPGSHEISGTYHGNVLQYQLSVYAEIIIVF